MLGTQSLISVNEAILYHIQYLGNESSRVSAATKLGMPISLIDEVCALDRQEVLGTARKYAENGVVITCSNLMFGKELNVRSLAIDSFFKSSLQSVK